MQADVIQVPEHCIIIKNWFEADELTQIFDELNLLRRFFLKEEQHTGAATNKDGTLLKRGKGVFLDELYSEDGRKNSAILKGMGKVFNPGLVEALIQKWSYFEQIKNSNFDSTLVNYYQGGGEYRQHTDQSVYTVCVFLWQEPKKFSGGNFQLRDTLIEIENNMLVIFPGFVKHGATLVEMEDTKENEGFGRWSIVKFIGYRN